MIRIGIVGAENTHSAAIAQTLNVERRVRGFAVVAIWGETKAFAAKTAEEGRIPTIVKKPSDMIGEIDAVVIDHRHPRHHLPAAESFLKARLPMFIDKPFCYRLAEGKRFLSRARRMRVPVTSFSTVPTYATFAALARQVGKAAEVCAAASVGPCEIDSKYGGIFFYGIHQVDVLMELFGPDVKAVRVAKGPGGAEAVVSLHFKGGLIASMHCLRGRSAGFQVAVATSKGPLAARLDADANPYLTGIRRFCRMFRTGVEPIDHRRILAPVAALEAMEKSVRTGELTKVAAL